MMKLNTAFLSFVGYSFYAGQSEQSPAIALLFSLHPL